MTEFVSNGTPSWLEDVNGNIALELPGGRAAALVTATPSGPGLEIQDGSDTRSFVTAEMSGGVPTGNFS